MKIKHLSFLIIFLIGTQFTHASSDSLKVELEYNADDLVLNNYRDAADWLWQIPGMWQRDFGTFGQWRTFRLDGVQTDQTQISLNGFPLVEPWLGTPDLAWIPTSMIEKIQIYPSEDHSISNQINFTSKSMPGTKPYTRILYRTGSWNYSVTDVTYGQKINRMEIMAGVVFSKLGNIDTTYQSQQHNGQSVHLNLNYDLSDSWKVKYQYLHNRLGNHLPFKLPPISDSLKVNHVNTERFDHGLGITGSLSKWRIKLQWAHTNHKYKFYRWQDINAQSVPTIANNFQLLVKRLGNKYDLTGKLTLLNRTATVTTYQFSDLYLFAKLAVKRKFNQRLTLSGHIGYINAVLTSNSDIDPVGSINLIWKRNENSQINFTFGKYIRIPTLAEKYGHAYSLGPAASYRDWNTLSENVSYAYILRLKNERAWKSTLQIKHKFSERVFLFVKAYFRYVDNLLLSVYDDTNMIYFINQKHHQYVGLSSEIKLNAFWGFEAGSVFNVLQARDWEDENLLERPTIWSSAYLRWGHAFFEEDLIATLQVGVRQWSDFYSLQSDVTDDNIYHYHDPQFLLYAKGSFRIMKNAVISYGMDNLTDIQTSLVNGIPLPGRTGRISVTWEMFN